MSKKQKAKLFELIFGLTLLLDFYIWYKSPSNIVGFLTILIIPSLFAGIIIKLIPSKNTRNWRRETRVNKATKHKSNSSTTIKYEHNLLRSEKEILTLPLDKLSWREFERLCYLYYKAKGYKASETSEGPDGGVDLIVYNNHHKTNVAIQIKHWKSGKQVTVKEIRELATAKKNHKCILADFITTSTFTKAALQEADKNKIKCFDIEWVSNKILHWRNEEAKRRKYA